MKRKVVLLILFLVVFFSKIIFVRATWWENETDVFLNDADYENDKATVVCSYLNSYVYGTNGPKVFLGVWIVYRDVGNQFEIVYDIPRTSTTVEENSSSSLTENTSTNEFILKPFDETKMGQKIPSKNFDEMSYQRSFISQQTYKDLIDNGKCPDNAYIGLSSAYNALLVDTVCFDSINENYCKTINNKGYYTLGDMVLGEPTYNWYSFMWPFDNSDELAPLLYSYLDLKNEKVYDLSNAFLDTTDDDIEIFFSGIDLGNADFDKGSEDLNLLCSKIAKSDSKELMKTIAQDTFLFNLKKYVTNKDISFLEPWDSYKRFKNLWEYKYNKIIREFLNYCDERNYEIDDEKKETISDADIVYDAGLNILGDKDITISETVGTCQSYLGLVSQEGEPAYYINIVYNVVKYLSIAFVIVLTILDAIKVLTSSDADKNLSEVFRKGIIRLIILIGIFLIPTLIEAIANLFGASNVLCGIG